MKPEDIKIDPELKDLLCPLSEYEEKTLRGSLRLNGCLQALIVDEKTGVLVDGHNRYRICKDENIPFEVKTCLFGNRETIEKFIIKNQVGRRNLTPERMESYIGQIYNLAKKKAKFEKGHEFKGNQHNLLGGQNDLPAKPKKTAEKIADQVGVSPSKVKRAGKKREALEKAGKLEEFEQGKLTKAEVKEIVDDSKPIRKQTKAEAKEEEEFLKENPQYDPDKKTEETVEKDRVDDLIGEIQSMQLTKQEVKKLIKFLRTI